MFNIQQLSRQIAAVAEMRLDLEQFDEWFVSSAWGHYGGDGDLSILIAAIHHILRAYWDDELSDASAAEELAAAMRPFEVDVLVEAKSPVHIWRHSRNASLANRVGNLQVVSGSVAVRKPVGSEIRSTGSTPAPVLRRASASTWIPVQEVVRTARM